MAEEEKERRRFQRIFFSLEDKVQGTFAFSGFQKGILTAHIINLGEGGLGLVLSKDEKKRIWKGGYVILTQIKGITGLEPLINVEAEIKWILDNPSLEFMGFGCEFRNVPAPMRDTIRAFIDSWHVGKI
jgi:hypothetical protein